MTPSARPLQFDVHPSVVFKLGEDLITDEVQALAELIKNSYDADATWAIVRTDSRGGHPEFPDDTGFIEIEDNGVGMDADALAAGWLVVSNSHKRTMKERGLTTDRGRSPLGDKGLGRLGVQRLGTKVKISSVPVGSKVAYELTIDWGLFNNFDALSKVPVSLTEVPTSRGHGTRIVVSGLVDREFAGDVVRIQSGLSKVISPYQGIQAFEVGVLVDGENVDLSEVGRMARDAAVVKYRFDFDGETLEVRGRMRLANLRPNSKKDMQAWHDLVLSDDGSGLLAAVLDKNPGLGIKRSASRGWWIEFSTSIALEDIKPVLGADGSPASPGPFHGEIDAYNLSSGSVEEVGVFNKLQDLRDIVKEHNGVRVYRDGFNVRVEGDWMGLGRQQSAGTSWYGIRLNTSIGYLAITSAGNAQLVETTDREGFRTTPAYRNLVALMAQLVAFSFDVQGTVGRTWVEYRVTANDDVTDQPPDADDLADAMSQSLNRVRAMERPLSTLSANLDKQASEADALVDRLSGQPLSNDEMAMLAAVKQLSAQATTARDLSIALTGVLAELKSHQATARTIAGQFDLMEEQLSLTYETMSVGLTAEALSHEIAGIADRLQQRTSEIDRYITREHPKDRRLGTYVRHVKSSVTGLRRQISHLAPSLRYVREQRETFQVSQVVAEVAEYFSARWDNSAMDLEVVVEDDFLVNINRGKLMQVLDNLLLNSEYWLKEDLRLDKIKHGTARVRVRYPHVRVEDTGRGVDRQVEASLFNPFVTRKPRGQGRGLGLFIISQLLDAEGCTVELLPDRNKSGRRYAFSVDLGGAVVDDK